MNPTDAALWDIERDPTLRTTIIGVLVLDTAPPFATLRDRVERATTLLPRLRHVVREPAGGVGVPSWVEDPHFELDYHVRHVRVPPPGDLDAVLALAAPMASGDFDRSRPVWELVYVDGLADGSAVAVLKVHHSLTDGVGGVDLLDAILDRSPEGDPEPDAPDAGTPPPRRSPAATAGRAAVGAATDALLDPVGTVRRTAGLVPSTARVLGPARQPRSPLMAGRGRGRRLAAIEVPTDALRAVAHAADGTLNDVLVATVLDAVARYHDHHGVAAPLLRFMTPVNLRRADHEAGGNQWAPARFDLPTAAADPVTRMRLVHEAVGSWRREPALGFNQTLAGIVQQLPGPLSAMVVAQMMRGVDVIVSNVPGVTGPRWFAGAAVRSMFAMAPTAGAAVNVTLVTHGDRAGLGVVADTAAVPDADVLVGFLQSAFDDVLVVADAPPIPAGAPAAAPTPGPVGAVAVPRIERLSFLDAGFLRAEGPRTPMNLGGVLLLDGGPLTDADGRLRLDDIRRHVAARLERVPRFRRRLVDLPLGGAYWVDDPGLRIEDHVLEVGVPAPGGLTELLEVAADLHATPLDRGRPLWELWFAAGLEDGRVAIIEKVHHALVDGVAGVELTRALFDAAPSSVVETPPAHPEAPPGRAEVARRVAADRAAAPFGAVRALARSAASPERFVRQVATIAGAVADGIAHPVGGGALHQSVGPRRRLLPVVIPRADLERARKGTTATLNDVVLTLVSGGLRAFDLETGEPLRDLRAAVPVAQPRRGDEAEQGHGVADAGPGNRVSVVLLPLPVTEPDPRRRLAAISDAMRNAKEHHRSEGVDLLFDVLDHLPPAIGAVVPVVHRQRFTDVVVTNVPGPAAPLWFLGAEAHLAVPIVPLLGNTDLAVAALSYRDQVCIALHADPDRCRDLDAIADGIRADLAVLAPPPRRRRPR
jgi:diacylglycerol O-acyltransferase